MQLVAYVKEQIRYLWGLLLRQELQIYFYFIKVKPCLHRLWSIGNLPLLLSVR